MTDSKNNVEQLHEAGALNKKELSEEHVKAINSLSQEEVEQLKSINKNVGNESDSSVGIFI